MAEFSDVRIDRLEELRTILINQQWPKNFDAFDMSDWKETCDTDDGCGTAGCLAGLAVAVYRPEQWAKLCDDEFDTDALNLPFDIDDVAHTAKRLLGLPENIATQLFGVQTHDYYADKEVPNVTREEVIDAIGDLIDEVLEHRKENPIEG